MAVEQQLATYSVEYTVLKEAMPDEPVVISNRTRQELFDTKNRVEELEHELNVERRRIKNMKGLLDR